MGKRKTLGRGIGAIIEEVEEAYRNDVEGGSEKVLDLPIENVRPNPVNPRKHFEEGPLRELADSITKHGLLQPVVVIKDEEGYILIAGERRWR